MQLKGGPTHLSAAISELVIRRGLARVQGDEQLQETWRQSVGTRVAARTRVLELRGGVLRIGVASSALLSELVSFQKDALLKKMQVAYPPIQDLKFLLRGNLGRSHSNPEQDGQNL